MDGESLSVRLKKRGALTAAQTAEVLFQLCSALAPVHKAGLPHGNLKASNVFLNRTEAGEEQICINDIVGSGVIDSEAMISRAPKNMSPSQVEGVDITIKSDFFSLGVLGYLLLTGDYPFAAPTPGQTADKIRERTYRPIGDKAGSGVLSNIIERCIKQIEGTEFQSLREIASALAGYLKNLDEDEPTSSPEDTETTHDDDPDATMAFQVPDELQAFLDQHDAYLDDGESQASMSVEAEQPEDTMNRPIGTLDSEDDLQQPFYGRSERRLCGN